MIKPLAVSLLLSLALGGFSVAIVGANLGGAIAIIIFAMLLSPIAGSMSTHSREAWIALLSASAGASLAAIGLRAHNAFSISQVFSIALTAFAGGLAAGALVRMLMRLCVSPLIASSIVIFLSLAWLSWPIWMSPWLSSEVLASRLAGVHPLIAVNAIAPQFGYWIQRPLMYRLNSLGQDVNFTLPTGVAGCVTLHLAIAAAGALTLIGRRSLLRGDQR